jgi:hypothetical protein
MRLLRRLFRKKRDNDRVDVALGIQVEVKDGEPKQYRTEDLSETGLRMDISGVSSLAELTGGHRDVGLGIVLDDGEEPARVVAEPIWTRRREDGGQSSGWMFSQYLSNARARLAAFISSHTNSAEGQ